MTDPEYRPVLFNGDSFAFMRFRIVYQDQADQLERDFRESWKPGQPLMRIELYRVARG